MLDERVRETLKHCAADLLSAYGLETAEQPVPAGEYEIAGAIGFTGALRGTLVIASTEAVVASLAGGEADAADWTAELANQLLGRIKNRFLRHGVEIALATPIAVRGLRMRCNTATPAAYVMLRAGSGDVVVGLEAVVSKNFTWVEESSPASLDEGALELF